MHGWELAALYRGAKAEAEWQRKDCEEGQGTWSLEGTVTGRIYHDKPNIEELDNNTPEGD